MLLCSRNERMAMAAREAATALHRVFRLAPVADVTQIARSRTVAIDLTVLEDIPREALGSLVRQWVHMEGGVQLVLVAPLHDPTAELNRLADVLLALAPFRPCLIVGTDAEDAHAWLSCLQDVRSTEALIVDSILQRLPSCPTRWDDVEELLRRAPSIRVMTRDLPGSRALQQRLLRDGQQNPKTMLLVFRAYWAAQMEQLRWSRKIIADRLQFGSADEYSGRIAAVFGMTKREFDQIPVVTFATWIAAEFLVRPDHAGCNPDTLRIYCLRVS